MRLIYITLTFVACFVSGSWAKQLAFVVGVSNYTHIDKLTNSSVDSKSVAKVLADAGYNVTLVPETMTTRSVMLSTWLSFVKDIEPGDEVVVYYSGHGVQVGGQNYIIPSDTPGPASIDETTLSLYAIPFRTWMDQLTDLQVGIQVWIIDACRTNPFVKNGRPFYNVQGGLGQIEGRSHSFIIYSADYNQIALDRLNSDEEGRNMGSPFTRTFVSMFPQWESRALDKFIKELPTRVVSLVLPNPQFPIYEDGTQGDWCFVRCEDTPPVVPSSTVMMGSDREGWRRKYMFPSPGDIASFIPVGSYGVSIALPDDWVQAKNSLREFCQKYPDVDFVTWHLVGSAGRPGAFTIEVAYNQTRSEAMAVSEIVRSKGVTKEPHLQYYVYLGRAACYTDCIQLEADNAQYCEDGGLGPLDLRN